MDFQLQEAYTGTLTHTRLLGAALQSRTSNCFSSRLFLDSHQCPFPSISFQGHACTQDNLYKQSDLSLCPGYPSRMPSSQVPTVLDKKTLVITQLWDTQIQLHSEFLTHLRCFNRREVLQGVPLHVPEPTLFFFPDASLAGWGTTWQTRHLSGQWSPPDSSQCIIWLELETIWLALLQWNLSGTTDCSSILRIQHGSCLLSQTRRNSFHLSVEQDTGIISPSASVCVSSLSNPSSQNVTVDTLSRINSPSPTEWRIPKETLHNLFSVLGTYHSGQVRHHRE